MVCQGRICEASTRFRDPLDSSLSFFFLVDVFVIGLVADLECFSVD